MQNTLSIIKPDAVKKGYTEQICARIEDSGLDIVLKKELLLTRNQAEGFYAEHKGKPFFEALINFMTSGPVQVQVCLLYTSPSPRDRQKSRMPSSA